MKTFPVIAFVFIFALSAMSQINLPISTPTPTSDADVVKISTNLIRIDVTVTDSKGRAVSDLGLNEIEIYENGEKQKITGLSYISSPRSVDYKPKPADPTLPVPPVSLLRPEQIRRSVAFVVDDLSLSFQSAYQTRRALKKFVDEQMQDGEIIAIIRTGAGIGALQQFTADKRILYAAIEKVQWNPLGSGGITAFAPLEAKFPTDPDAPEPEPGERTIEGIERELRDFREGYFATGTLGALDYMIRGMSELPGRKSVILFSDGFATVNVNAQGGIEGSSILDPLKRLIDRANRSSVVVYAMDPRGLVYPGLTAADSTTGRTREELEQDLTDRNNKLIESQQTLKYISEETGGFAVINTNDLSSGVRRVLDDQSYYLIAYEPDSETFNPAERKFNKLEVKVLRSGANVRYRSGFFNVVDRGRQAMEPLTTAAGQLEYALVSPFAVSGINLRLNALFGSDAKNPMYVRSLLHVSAKDLKFTDAGNGLKKVVFDVLAMSFGDNGQVVDQLSKNYTLTATPDAYAKLTKEGFVYDFLFPVKQAGAYQYRVAIRDSQGGQVGSASQFIEVPNPKNNRLTVSSIVLETLTPEKWRQAIDVNAPRVNTDPITDTALRLVSLNSVLRYGFEVYNARLDSAKRPQIETKIRVFHDGKLVLDGKQIPFDLAGQTDMLRLKMTGAISIGEKMLPGDYILQIIVTDKFAKSKHRIATQFVQFEVVK